MQHTSGERIEHGFRSRTDSDADDCISAATGIVNLIYQFRGNAISRQDRPKVYFSREAPDIIPPSAHGPIPMPNRFKFDPEKALEAILYVACNTRDPGLHLVSKILYFADQRHLREYGRFITGDTYVAMKHGPVPSSAYDMMKWVRDQQGASFRFSEQLAAAFEVRNGRQVRALREPQLDVLSESELQCLQGAIAQYGQLRFGQLTRESHDAAWNSADENDFIELSAIVDMQPNREELRELLDLQ